MRKILFTSLVFAGLAWPQGRPLDWPSYGGNAQRTGWEKSDTRITRDNIKDFRLVLKQKLDDKDLTAPSIIGLLISYRGFKELAMVAGSNDNVWAIDADLERVLWHRRLDSTAKSSGCGAPTPALTPPMNFAARPRPRPAVTATSVPPVPSARVGGTGFGAPRSVFALASDGVLHQLNSANGVDQFPPLPFLPANAKASVLTVQDGVVYTTTSSSCGGGPDAVWALDLNDADPKPVSFVSKTGAVAGLGGFAIGGDGTVYLQTSGAVIALSAKDLKPKESFKAAGGAVTPVVFAWQKKELVASAGKDGKLYLLDSETMAPLSQTEPGPEVRGGLSTWEDDDGARWMAAPGSRSIVAYKVEERDGKPVLAKAWTSPEMNSPQPPVITGGAVFVVAAAPHATLYALDAATGKELYSTGNQVTAPANLTGVTVANGRVYFTTADKTLYAFGIFLER